MVFSLPGVGLSRRLVIAAVVALVALLALGAYWLMVQGDEGDFAPTLRVASSPSPAGALRPERRHSSTAGPSLTERDPESFAGTIAETLFAWDTRTSITPASVAALLATVADPTGESSAGLVADIAGYLPTEDAWDELQRYDTHQWLEITALEVPDLWATAVAQAGPDGLLPGTTAYTIRGVRHRAGLWEGEPVSSTHEVAFTVFIVCEPSYPECHLLRLSRLDEPLE